MTTCAQYPIDVVIRHPYRMVVDALVASFPNGGDFRLNPSRSDISSSADIAIVDPQAALDLLADEPAGRCRIIALGVAAREFEVHKVIQAGAFGFLVLNSGISEVRECLQSVSRGKRYICREAALSMVSGMTRSELTAREQMVLGLLADGLCNKSIARELTLADGTVKAHVRSILSKLGASTRTQAARFAVERGLVVRE